MPRTRPSPRPEPLGNRRYKVELTIDADVKAKLEEAQELLSHRVPDGDVAALFELALDALNDKARRERFAELKRPASQSAEPTAPAGQAPAAKQATDSDGPRGTDVVARAAILAHR